MALRRDYYSRSFNPECFDPYRKDKIKHGKLEVEENGDCLDKIIYGCGCGCLMMAGGGVILIYGSYKLFF